MKQFAEQAREQRLAGNHHDNGRLLGYCFDNAFVLYNILSENGYEPQIVCGASERYSEEVLRETPITEMDSVHDLAGLVHYWVEVRGTVIDIASDVPSQLGEILISETLPEPYHRLDDSYEYAQDILQSAPKSRCSYCGGRNRYCGCPYEQ